MPRQSFGIREDERLCIKPRMQEQERNAGNTGNGENVIFWGMSPNILENVLKHSGECPQAFREMPLNIIRNVLKHSRKCPQTFQEMSSNIPGIVAKHSGESPQAFWEIIGQSCI